MQPLGILRQSQPSQTAQPVPALLVSTRNSPPRRWLRLARAAPPPRCRRNQRRSCQISLHPRIPPHPSQVHRDRAAALPALPPLSLHRNLPQRSTPFSPRRQLHPPPPPPFPYSARPPPPPYSQ